MRELDHRVKNALATVQSVAEQTLHSTTSREAFSDAFFGRLHALARIHGALTARRWEESGGRTYDRPRTTCPLRSLTDLAPVEEKPGSTARRDQEADGSSGHLPLPNMRSREPRASQTLRRLRRAARPHLHRLRNGPATGRAVLRRLRGTGERFSDAGSNP